MELRKILLELSLPDKSPTPRVLAYPGSLLACDVPAKEECQFLDLERQLVDWGPC